MHSFRKIGIFFAFIVIGYASQDPLTDSIAPLYANYAGLDLLSDAPWIIKITNTIPFSFIIKDCDQYSFPGEAVEFYCLAIYDISDGIKYYNGVEIVPSVNQIDTIIAYPPLVPYANYGWSYTPNQIYYEDFKDMGYLSPPNLNTYNWWKKEVNTFKHVGSKWDNYGLNGEPITPAVLGYSPGDTITLRTIIVCRVIVWNQSNNTWLFIPRSRERDLRIIVVGDQNPLPKLSNWYLTDCHTHSWNTDNEIEYGGVTPFMVKTAKKIGLDCVILTDHSNDCGWVQDHNDGWGSGTNWNHCGWEINQYQDVLLIRGEEISARKIRGEGKWVPYPPFYFPPCHNWDNERHFLGFGLSTFIEGWHPLTAGYPGLKYDVNEVLSGGPPPNYGNNPLNNIRAQGGFAYYSHPGDYFANLDDSATIDSAILHRTCRGLQIFNCRKTHSSSDEMHPWGEFPYGQSWENSYADWFEVYKPIIRIWDRYMAKHLDGLRKKVFVLGGSDAHGGFNYSPSWDAPFGDYFSESAALGSWRTAVYCPTGLTRDNILNGLKMGRSVVTDGPMLIFGLDMNNDGDIYDAGRFDDWGW